MELSKKKLNEFIRRILTVRMKILSDQSFYGLLLMHVKMNVNELHETAWTDDTSSIYLNPEFIDSISDEELEYVLEHLVMHIAIKHMDKKPEGCQDDNVYNTAADIVVNSSIMMSHNGNKSAISLSQYGGVQMHETPYKTEGYQHTIEEICDMLNERVMKHNGYKSWDYHFEDDDDESFESEKKDLDKVLSDMLWKSWIMSAADAVLVTGGKMAGKLPLFLERYITDIREPKLDWRVILNDFVQEEITDYSFTPPDRRYSDSPFFLPDFNDTDCCVKKLLFMIDTSGSMSEDDISSVYSEVKGAIDQYNGKLQGWVGFFDAVVYPPEPFADEDEFRIIKPKGGGGTDFHIIFDYVKEQMSYDSPILIIIMTDGYAPFPDETVTEGTPVLWVLTTEEEPPWGRVARLNQ